MREREEAPYRRRRKAEVRERVRGVARLYRDAKGGAERLLAELPRPCVQTEEIAVVLRKTDEILAACELWDDRLSPAQSGEEAPPP